MWSEDRDSKGSDASTSQGMARVNSSHQKWGERPGSHSSLEVLEGTWPSQHLDFGLLASRTGREKKLLSVSDQYSSSVMSDSLQPHGLQHARLPCPSPTPRACSNLCPSSQWCHPIISYSVIPFSSWLQSFLVSGYFPMSQFFASGGQSIGVSASTLVLPTNIQDWFPLGLTGLVSLQSKGLPRVFSNTTVQKHQFFCAQLSL